MPKHLISLCAASLLLASAGPAFAAQWPVFDSISFTADGIPDQLVVTSEDGKAWTTLKPAKLHVTGVVRVKMDKGKANGFFLKHGGKTIYEHTGLGKTMTENVNAVSHTSHLGIAALSAVSACNALLTSPGKIESDHYIGISTDIEVLAGGETWSHKRQRSGFGALPIRVKCVGVPKQQQPQPQPVADDDLVPVFGVKSASLLVREPASNACPTKGKLTASFETNVPGKVKFIYRQAGGGKSAPITIQSKKRPNGKFIAIHQQIVPVKGAMDTKYMVEVVGKGVISGWKAFKAPCKIGLGGGGGVATPPEVPMKALSAQLGIIGPKTKVCPNTAKMTAWIKTNKAGKIGFRIMRKDGPVGPMIFATAVKSGNGYMATYSRKVTITGPVDQAYSVVVPGSGGVASNFVPLKASCKIKLPGANLGN